MTMSTRRLQVLIDDERLRRLRAEAQARRSSVGAVVREAIDRTFPISTEQKRAAAKAILSARAMPVPEEIKELTAELEEIRSGAKR
jgi:hypothetical protein